MVAIVVVSSFSDIVGGGGGMYEKCINTPPSLRAISQDSILKSCSVISEPISLSLSIKSASRKDAHAGLGSQ